MTSIGTFRPTIANPASEKQVAFLTKLINQQYDLLTQNAAATGDLDDFAEDRLAALEGVEEGVSKRLASDMIDTLLNITIPGLRRKLAAATPVAADRDGFYLIDGDVIKCQYSQSSGKLYAKVLDRDSGKFEYTPGAVRRTEGREKMTLEQAKEFGHLYGVCCVCGATLTAEPSVEAGIGPICAKKF